MGDTIINYLTLLIVVLKQAGMFHLERDCTLPKHHHGTTSHKKHLTLEIYSTVSTSYPSPDLNPIIFGKHHIHPAL